ncbi:serine/threonine-protein kinase [Klenkia terrae]|uniref:serine/threonine-protein kinase n=1 Tax=Klenkia terrae TaxID=1052259 RepID=UPI001CD885F8|nr:serine/threonine-protein kinase [Klenkia terrae]
MTTPAEVGPGYRVAGRYRLDSRIAGGGMGAVWLATDERLGRQVAVKQVVLPVGVSPEAAAEQRARTMREGRIAARITHPHAISVYDVVDDGGSPWLVMEHLPSRSLAAVLSADGVLPVQQVAQIGAQLADALVATHAAGIVHRDVKPGNVLVGEGDRLEGLVKITDFGISHATGDVRLTQTGMVTGTPAFLSPEVARGEEPGAAGDVWSLGATLFTALEGDPPFGSSGNSLEQLYRVAAGQFDPPVRPARRRSRTPLVLAALVAVLVLAGGGTWLALRDTGSGTAAAPTTTTATTTTDAPPPAVAPPTTAEQTTSAPPTTTEAPTTEPDVVTAAEVSQFVTDYYALLPDDPDSAYGLTGPTLQGVSSRGNYKSFWKRFDEVVLGPVSATDGSLVATAQVTFVEDDEEQVEQHQFTLVEGPDGTLLMDRDIPL